MEGGSGGVERFPEGRERILNAESSWFSSQFQVFQRRRREIGEEVLGLRRQLGGYTDLPVKTRTGRHF